MRQWHILSQHFVFAHLARPNTHVSVQTIGRSVRDRHDGEDMKSVPFLQRGKFSAEKGRDGACRVRAAAHPSCFLDKYIAVVPSPDVSLPHMRLLALNLSSPSRPSASHINSHPLYLLHQACFDTILCLSYFSFI
jgi:hypothetical protein